MRPPTAVIAPLAALAALATVAHATIFEEIASHHLAGGAANDEFGAAVAMQEDLVAVGAPRHDAVASNGGVVVILQIDAGTGGLTPIATLRPELATNADLFGTSVAMDGDVVVVGAIQERNGGQGRAYVFQRPAEGWAGLVHETAVLRASDRGSGDLFGRGVAVEGGLVAVGAAAEDEQGGQAGSVYLFERPDEGWDGVLEEVAKLLPASGATQYTGRTVALQDSLVIAGAHLRSFDGGTHRGAAYVWAEPDTGWGGRQEPTATLTASDTGGGDRFGISVDLEGTTLVVGAHTEEPAGANVNHGCIYVFEEPAGGWVGAVHEVAKLRMSDPSSQAMFGWNARIDADRVVGTSLVKEAAYVFERPADGWTGVLTETVKVQAGDPGNDEFGAGVFLAGPYLAVGAPEHDGLETDAGKLYLFEEGTGVGVWDASVPGADRLTLRSWPNPFNPRTTVSFELAHAGRVRLEAIDARGRRVALLWDGPLAAGRHERAWAPRDLPSGVYHLVLRQGARQGAGRVTLLK